MREPLRDRECLNHMLSAVERVIRYTLGKTFDDLKSDDMMYYAVVKNIDIIGEAANLLSPEFIDSHPATPWKQVKGMRNYIVHEIPAKKKELALAEKKQELAKINDAANNYL